VTSGRAIGFSFPAGGFFPFFFGVNVGGGIGCGHLTEVKRFDLVALSSIALPGFIRLFELSGSPLSFFLACIPVQGLRRPGHVE